MENPSDSGSSHIIKITHLGKKVKRQTHSPEQNFSNAINKHHKKRDILQEAQNHHMLKYVQGKDISDITPHGQSYQNSPVHFNILAELGASTTPIKQMPGLFEDSESFGVHFENDVVESTNLNSKIAQILTDSKSELDMKDPHEGKLLEAGKVDLSFSVRTDYSVDMNDNTETHRLKRSRREKVPSKVTIDESLNTDLMYDPDTSATAQGKSDKKKKPEPKKEVINVYTKGSPKRAEPVKETGNMTPEGKQPRKISANLEYKPTKTEEDEDQVESLYHGVTTPDRQALERESRWSKLEEDQAAKLFQERKTNIFEGLKKLNKTKTVAVSTKSNQPSVSPKRSARQGDGKKDAVKLDSWSEGNSMQSRVVDLRTGKVVKKRASSNQRPKRTSVTPKKEPNSNRFNPPKSLSVDLKLRSRSLSNDDPKPIEQFLKNYSSNRPPAEKTQMIDEIYKQAKEDVQKRIANIERKLLENESYDLRKSNSSGVSTTVKSEPKILSVSSPQSNNQTPTLFGSSQRKISAEANLESSKKSNSRPRSPENMDVYRPSQEQRSPEKMVVISPSKATRTPSSSKATPVKVTFVSPQGSQQRNVSFNVAPPAEVEKVSIKQVKRVERGNSKEPVANGNKRPQQAIQAPSSPDAYFNLRQATGGNESKRGNTPTKMANSTPTKFSDIEQQASQQRSSYSKIHAERAVRAFASPQAKDNQIPLEDSVANFLMLEKTLKAQIAKEAASGSKRKPPSHGSPVRPQNIRPSSKEPKEQDNYRTNARREDPQLKDRKNMNAEVKQFTLRPQSVEKTPVKRSNPASQSDGFKRSAEKSTPDKTVQLRKASKEPKSHANTATNFFNAADQWQDSNKIPRSSSDQKIKAMAFTKSPKAVLNRVLQTDHNRPQMIDNSNETSLMSTKSVSTIGRQPVIPNKSEMVRRDKPVRTLASPEIHKNSKTTISEADESMGSKNDYLKSLFNKQKATPAVVAEKKSPQMKPQQPQRTPQKQKVEENLVYATSSDDLEELLKQNYRFLEIRNNQYVFTNSS